jgi:D-serine deaminase-like pyridoxal phosphate-dependent protein
MNPDKIKKPSLVIDKAKAIKNIRAMKFKAEQNHAIFRPHFKTHQSSIVSDWYKNEGITAITVSSVRMAYFFADMGWKDISIAFPLNIREIEAVTELAGIISLNVLVSNEIHANILAKHLKNNIGVFIKIDTGYHRCGLQLSDIARIEFIVKILESNKNLIFKGFLSHFGNTYHAHNKKAIIELFRNGVVELNLLKNKFISCYPGIMISVGDTPSCSIIDDFMGVNEIRPGNFVYYDLTMLNLGVCIEEQIAVVVACPIIDKYPDRNEILIYGGAVHLSKEYLLDNKNNKNFGSIVRLYEKSWSESIPGAYVKSISQEHGLISMNSETISSFQIGDLLGILPVHSCLSADLLGEPEILD